MIRQVVARRAEMTQDDLMRIGALAFKNIEDGDSVFLPRQQMHADRRSGPPLRACGGAQHLVFIVANLEAGADLADEAGAQPSIGNALHEGRVQSHRRSFQPTDQPCHRGGNGQYNTQSP